METLRAYLATLAPIDQAAYAARCGTSIGYLRKALSTKPRLDGALARRLDEESSGCVSRYELRADVFGDQPEDGETTNASARRAHGVDPERHRPTAASAGATAEATQAVLTRKVG